MKFKSIIYEILICHHKKTIAELFCSECRDFHKDLLAKYEEIK